MVDLALCIAYIIAAEYVGHRFVQHRGIVVGKKSRIFQRHAVEHHAKRRHDINIAVGPLTAIAVASPMFLVASWWVVIGCALVYDRIWTSLHSAHHDLPGYEWVRRIPGYRLFRRHHLAHHTKANTNYGAVFIFTDYLFGTKA